MSTSDLIHQFVYEKGSLIFLVVDEQRKIIEANKFAEKLFGDSLAGRDLTELIIDFQGDINFSRLAEEGKQQMLNVNTAAGLPETYYFTFLKSDKELILIGESKSDEIEGLRKSMLELNNELNNLTRELQKKNVQLSKLNEQKNEFLGMAAHDLRNPISVIMAYSEFILDEAEERLDPEHVKFIRIIISSSEFMLNMLNDLLDIAKIESGKLNLSKEKVDIEKLINTNVSLNRAIAQNKGINIMVELFDKIPEVYIDPAKIEQVLNNLISNAIKFSDSGTTVTVSAFRSKDHVTVSVKDQGQGIPKEDIDKLFKPFSKLSVQSTAGEKSTGLGLTITRKIIVGHGGNIWVESEVNKGTTFYFSIPIEGK